MYLPYDLNCLALQSEIVNFPLIANLQYSFDVVKVLKVVVILSCRERAVWILNPGLGDKLVVTNTDNMLSSVEESEEPQGWLIEFSTKKVILR